MWSSVTLAYTVVDPPWRVVERVFEEMDIAALMG
jgi:hypothetical protein